jgi:hypothetical protein
MSSMLRPLMACVDSTTCACACACVVCWLHVAAGRHDETQASRQTADPPHLNVAEVCEVQVWVVALSLGTRLDCVEKVNGCARRQAGQAGFKGWEQQCCVVGGGRVTRGRSNTILLLACTCAATAHKTQHASHLPQSFWRQTSGESQGRRARGARLARAAAAPPPARASAAACHCVSGADSSQTRE